jgi:hypothetical protein
LLNKGHPSRTGVGGDSEWKEEIAIAADLSKSCTCSLAERVLAFAQPPPPRARDVSLLSSSLQCLASPREVHHRHGSLKLARFRTVVQRRFLLLLGQKVTVGTSDAFVCGLDVPHT